MGRIATFWLALGVLLAVVAGSGLSAAAREEGPEVIDVRVAPHDDGSTRFVLEVSEDIPFTVASIAGGITIDTPVLDWRSRAAGQVRPVGLVTGFSYGMATPSQGRIFITTGDAVAVQKAFMIPANREGAYRLVVDIAPAVVDMAPTPPKLIPPGSDNPLLGHGKPITLAAADPPPLPLPPPAPLSKPMPEPAVAEIPMPSEKEHGKDRGKPVVMLDPGHGGVDPGTTGLSGEYEKEIVLAIALAVKDKLDKDGKVKCLMTRDGDTFIPLQERVAIARAAHADLFMSLHADSDPDPNIRGLSIYTLSKTASDATAQALADKENKSDLVAGLDLAHANPEVTNILLDLVQRETLNLSAVFAGLVIDEVQHDTRALLQNTHRFAGFAVLKAPDVPSVLVETGYLSNPLDEQALRRPEYRTKLAAALARAIERYFARNHDQRHG
jgi:N-acetylmuramoyl-L-alanine amidase